MCGHGSNDQDSVHVDKAAHSLGCHLKPELVNVVYLPLYWTEGWGRGGLGCVGHGGNDDEEDVHVDKAARSLGCHLQPELVDQHCVHIRMIRYAF